VWRGATQSPKLHLHQKSTCWKLLGMMRSHLPFSFLRPTSMDEDSGLLELTTTGASKKSKEGIRVRAQCGERLGTRPRGYNWYEWAQSPSQPDVHCRRWWKAWSPEPWKAWATAQVLPEQSLCSAVAPEGALAACRQVGREWELSSESPTNPAQLPTVLPPSSPHTGASPGLAILLVVEW
jgi:hypothetical protein